MTLLEYSKKQFLIDLESLQKNEFETKPDLTSKALFFGGSQWENFKNDISKIDIKNRDKFCVCLFTMTSADQNAHSHFPELLPNWLQYFKYPKFGGYSFGPYFEKVNYLLDVPVAHEINFDTISQEQINEFIISQFQDGCSVLGNQLNDFFQKMVNDPDFNSNTDIFSKIKEGIVTILEQ
jgi:hypothetical protein